MLIISYKCFQTRIFQWSLQLPIGAYLRAEPLCYSLNNNEIPLLTITADDCTANPIAVCTLMHFVIQIFKNLSIGSLDILEIFVSGKN